MQTLEIAHKHDIKGYTSLENLALDLRSTWNHSADVIWKQIDPELWSLSHNPWAVLQNASKEKLAALLEDKKFSDLLNTLVQTRKEELGLTTWFQEKHPNSPLSAVVYFSMEFMLSEALPIYSGGLGNVAGDQLKAASDLGVPVIGIGLLYSQGYFRQFIDKSGNQQELYPYNEPGQLPIRPARLPNGELIRLKIELPGWPFWIRCWEVKVGRRTLYLLDSNDIANFPAHRGITSELYGGDRELRIKQELILGIGGWRLLEALGIHPEVCHLNEGHAAFAVLERAASFMRKTNLPFDAALEAIRGGNLFTTHTAVAAGFDRFSPDLVSKYTENYAKEKLGISMEKLLSLGQINPGDDFNMAYLAIRGSGFVNGVSKLHGDVSRHLFENLFPRYPEQEVPVGSVTNGVHMPSWDSALADDLWSKVCGKGLWHRQTEGVDKKIRTLSDDEIWRFRNESRKILIDFTRARLVRQLEARGAPKEEVERAKQFLNPNALTLGFARRFAVYKRPDLLLMDEDRFIKILTNKDRPVQLIIAGKAHPADGDGHALIKKWMNFISRPEVREHVIFVSDYDMIVTEHLVQGVDLWVNTPRRPWEASGTSGMKVLVNGGLNISELDGWWVEAYTPEVGWAFGDGKEHGFDPNWDRVEANIVYDLLEKEIIPEFYNRNEKGIPAGWTAKIRESMAQLTPRFSSARTVREYTEKYYLPAAERYHQRAKDKGALAKSISDWQASLKQNWGKLAFGELVIANKNNQQQFEVQVFLNGIAPQAVKVQLYSDAKIVEMVYVAPVPGNAGGHTYRAELPATYLASDFTARIIPYFPGVAVPLEAPYILWQR